MNSDKEANNSSEDIELNPPREMLFQKRDPQIYSSSFTVPLQKSRQRYLQDVSIRF